MWPPPPIKLKMLIAIAILPLLLFYTKQTWAQEKPTEPSGQQGQQPANGMPQTYGLGEYAMDDNEQVMVPGDAKLLDTDDDVKNYKAKNADKQFKPCMMEINKDNKFQLVYDEDTAKDGCTVDLVIGPSEDEKKMLKSMANTWSSSISFRKRQRAHSTKREYCKTRLSLECQNAKESSPSPSRMLWALSKVQLRLKQDQQPTKRWNQQPAKRQNQNRIL